MEELQLDKSIEATKIDIAKIFSWRFFNFSQVILVHKHLMQQKIYQKFFTCKFKYIILLLRSIQIDFV